MHISISRRDVIITADHRPLEIFLSLPQRIRETAIPLHFELVSGRTHRLSIGCVNGDDAHIADIRRDHARLIIFDPIAQSDAHFARFFSRQNSNTIIRLCP